jgi:hypothetical protein
MTEHTDTIDTTGTADDTPITDAQSAEIRMHQLDDAHLAWFIAESECERALRAWGAGEDADLAYCSYLAALNREESAARHLERMLRASEPRALTLVQRMHDVAH